MSEESTTLDPVELVRGIVEAGNRHDVDGLIAFCAPDALLDGTRTVGEQWRGRAGIRGFVQDWMGAYEEMEWAAEESVDLGHGVSYARVRQSGRPVGSTGNVRQCQGWVSVWANGLIASLTFYPEAQIDAARAAAERLAKERGWAASENLDLVRSIYAATGRGDYLASAAFINPDIKFTSVGGPDHREVRGLVPLADQWREFLNSWEDFRVVAEDYRELDDSRVLVLFRRSGRGKVSGMEIAQLAGAEGADVLHLHDGKVIEWFSYWERDRALADLGLEA